MARLNSTDTRERIIECAGSILASDGPLSVKPSLIALRLNVSPSLINYHFPDPTLLCSYGAGRLLLRQVSSETDALSQKLSNDCPTREEDSKSVLQDWYSRRITWTGKFANVAPVLAFPNIYNAQRIEEWLSANTLTMSNLVPHLVSLNQFSVLEAHLAAELLHRITFIGEALLQPQTLLHVLEGIHIN